MAATKTKDNDKLYLPIITWNQKYSSKQAVQITYTVEKKIFAAATLKGLWDVCFQTEKKLGIIWSFWSAFLFLEKRGIN